jgi:hypothetical protein
MHFFFRHIHYYVSQILVYIKSSKGNRRFLQIFLCKRYKSGFVPRKLSHRTILTHLILRNGSRCLVHVDTGALTADSPYVFPHYDILQIELRAQCI